jgi:two-component system response regulator YesN
MFYLNEDLINKRKNVDIPFLIITEVEKAEDIDSLVKIARTLIELIMESIGDHKVSTNPYIRVATNYIISNLDQKITLDIVSNQLSISSKYLSKLFKNELNITFKDYLIEKRINKAKKLLLYTNKSINDISIAIGIQNSNNFIAFFKNYVKQTPYSFRINSRT